MYIILTKDEHYQYKVIQGYLSNIKLFKDQWEAVKYVLEMKIDPYQLIEIEI